MRLRILLVGIVGLVTAADAEACGGRIGARLAERRQQRQQQRAQAAACPTDRGPVQRIAAFTGQAISAIAPRSESPPVFGGCSGPRCPVSK